ncbi:MAG TPA: tripartite tricarboxylate transporter substrate-binding protein [Candidatus Binatia bacterium]|jgi:tripartite-type tricarboxylate transporter receptor subunit TctC|nr:tripartite tricarboxylate transporter substrate-binding protein [Candidatus Binatia bacterium]
MRRKILIFLFSLLFCGFFIAAAGQLFAAEHPYYEGKTIRIIVSSSPGGGTDTSARLVSRFMSKYIPGNPKTIVQNMPGGGGTIANNYFASEVKPDGLTLMQDSSSGIGNFVRGGPTIKYDPRKFKVIGGVARPGSLVMIRNDARPRLMDSSAKPVVVGDTDGIRTWVAMTVWGAEYLGWNLRWIYGYPGSRELALAIRQGEIDMWATQNAKLVKDLQREGVVQILATEEDRRREDFADVPTFVELLGSKRPSGLAWQGYLGWAGAPELDKFLVAPEGTPDPLMKLLREAFSKVMKDPEVDKEGDKFFGEGWRPHPGEKIEAVIREHIAIPKEALDFITKMRQKYGLPVGEKKS